MPWLGLDFGPSPAGPLLVADDGTVLGPGSERDPLHQAGGGVGEQNRRHLGRPGDTSLARSTSAT